MTFTRAILRIPGNRLSATISSNHKGLVLFNGNEDQTARITFAIPPMVGGNMYTVSEGELSERAGVKRLKIDDGAGLGSCVEIEFTDNTILRVTVLWKD